MQVLKPVSEAYDGEAMEHKSGATRADAKSHVHNSDDDDADPEADDDRDDDAPDGNDETKDDAGVDFVFKPPALHNAISSFRLTKDNLPQLAVKDTLEQDQSLVFQLVGERLLHELAVERINQDALKPTQSYAQTQAAHAALPELDPMRLLVLGSAGSGKSKVIKSIRNMFELCKHREWLAIAAPTGAAASQIGGRTNHSLTGMRATNKNESKVDDEPDVTAPSGYTVKVAGSSLQNVRFGLLTRSVCSAHDICKR